MSSVEPWLLIGQVVGVHGIRGELKIRSMTDFPERLTRPGTRRLVTGRGEERQVNLLGGRLHQGNYLVRLEDIPDRSAAELLIGAQLFVAATDRPVLAEGEFHVLDLVGLAVRRQDTQVVIGTVKDVVNTGLQDLLVIVMDTGERMVPFVDALVPKVDLAAGWLEVVPLPGLLDPRYPSSTDGPTPQGGPCHPQKPGVSVALSGGDRPCVSRPSAPPGAGVFDLYRDGQCDRVALRQGTAAGDGCGGGRNTDCDSTF
jgi:16S rRNA processing protein RimM